MTACLTARVTAEQLVDYVSVEGEVTAHQVADHFDIRWAAASSRLSKLAAYGRLRTRHIPRRPCGKFAVYRSAQ